MWALPAFLNIVQPVIIVAFIRIFVNKFTNIFKNLISPDDKKKGVVRMANMALTEAVNYILLFLAEPKHGYDIMQNMGAFV